MKYCYLVAASLAAWTLIAPGNKWIPDSGGSLMPTQWINLGQFASEAQCEDARRRVAARVAKEFQADHDAHREPGYHLGDAAFCVPPPNSHLKH
jgi:hypothetical protein